MKVKYFCWYSTFLYLERFFLHGLLLAAFLIPIACCSVGFYKGNNILTTYGDWLCNFSQLFISKAHADLNSKTVQNFIFTERNALNDLEQGLLDFKRSRYATLAKINRANVEIDSPLVLKYAWQARFINNQLFLSGHMPSVEDRDLLVGVANTAFGQNLIFDKITIKPGAPPDWLATTILAINHLALLEEGATSLRGTTLNLSGIVKHQESVKTLSSSLRNKLSPSFELEHDIKYEKATVALVRPFKSVLEFRNGVLILNGHVPAEELKNDILAQIRLNYPDAVVINRMVISGKAPEGWLNCILAGLNGLLKLEQGTVTIVDSKLTLVGLTRQEEIGEALPKQLRAAANRACQETIDLRVEIPPEPLLKWYAKYQDKGLTVSGEVPDSGVKEKLTNLANQLFPNVKVTAELRVNPSRTSKWPQVAEVALQSLAKLRRGEVRIVSQTLILTGEAKDTAAETAIRQQLKSGIPKGYMAHAYIQVKSAAMLWAERQVKYSEQKNTLHNELQSLKIENKKQERGNSHQPLISEQPATFMPNQSNIPNSVGINATHNKDLKQNLKMKRERCERAINDALRSDNISFKLDGFQVTMRDKEILDRFLIIKQICKGHKIKISGHTDSRGSNSNNMVLSEKRADAVRSYLVSIGIPKTQLITRGYGETRPLFPNSTPENRTRNSRIEFKVMTD
ncbi:MAG: OmpA family protein [Hyphomicrobiaceae bacterium]|nr:OmpA family protein [Hyphomicrobiaceae bacterium]